MIKFLWTLFLDEYGGTLAITRKTSNTLITAAGFNTNYDEIEAVVNGDIDADNIEDDAVTAAKLNSDVVRANYGLIQHTDGTLYVDVSDTNPCLEITDGGLRVKVDDSSVERASGGLQVKALGITNAMLAGSIADGKLNQIATASKVHGTALTGLASVPSGAGALPLANGGTAAATAAAAFTNIVVPKIYDSGWFAVAASTTYTKTHDLNTTAVIAKVYVANADDNSGWVINEITDQSNADRQCAMVALSTTQIKIRTATTLGYFIDENGTEQNPSSGYARIIILACA